MELHCVTCHVRYNEIEYSGKNLRDVTESKLGGKTLPRIMTLHSTGYDPEVFGTRDKFNATNVLRLAR